MNTAESSRPLRIAAVGLGEQMKNALRLLFRGPCKIACVLAPEASAELTIVDVDRYNGARRLANHAKLFPQRPVIVLSLQEQAFEGAILLRKPVTPAHLFDAIKQAKEQLSETTDTPARADTAEELESDSATPKTSPTLVKVADRPNTSDRRPKTDIKAGEVQARAPSTHRAAMHLDERSANAYIGSARDIDPEDSDQLVNAQYDPKNFFQSYLEQAYATSEREHCSVVVECPQGVIAVAPKSTTISLTLTEHKLRTLSTMPVNNDTFFLSRLTDTERLATRLESRTVDSEGLMWRTALWASRGRVPVGTCLLAPVAMRRWPNLTKLLVFPHALRIAALWAQAPYSLADTAKYLDVPQRNVFAFYSATHAIGLVGMAQGHISNLLPSTPTATPGRSRLFSRIINRLKRKSPLALSRQGHA